MSKIDKLRAVRGKYAEILPHSDELIRQRREDVCDHTNCIPRSELPGLPEGWKVAQIDPYAGISNTSKPIPHCERLAMIWSETKTMTAGEYQFLLKVLNTCYPAPTTTKECNCFGHTEQWKNNTITKCPVHG